MYQFHTKEQINSLEKANNTLQEILDYIFSDNNSNNFLSQLEIIIEKYKSFVSTLQVEQLISLINILGLIIILSFLISIAAIFYNDYLIKYFNIEKKIS